MTIMKKKTLFVTCSLLAFTTAVGASVAADLPAAGKAINVSVLHTNDHHSYLDSSTYTLKLDIDAEREGAESLRVQLGGFSRIATAIGEYRGPNSLVLNSGELNGTLYFSLFKGEADFKVFNALGLDAYQLGNHEFDEGDEHLASLIEMAEFPILSSNVHPTEDSPLYGAPIKPYIIKEIEGEKVAVVGVLKVEKTQASSMVSDAVEFSDEIETVRSVVGSLEAQGINKIIVLSHLGYNFDQTLAARVDGIDAIVGGDTHEALDSSDELASMGIDVAGFNPTMVRNPSGEPVYITQAWEYAKGLGQLNLAFDANGKVTDVKGKLELLVGQPYQVQDQDGQYQPATDAQVAAIQEVIAGLESIREIETSAKVDEIIKPYREEIENYRSQTIGSVEQTMPFERFPADFEAGEVPTGSYAAQVVSDAFLTYLPQADISIQNAGGVRAEINSGAFTVGDAYTVLPFSNTVVTVDMTGAEVVKVLNEALDYSQGLSGSTGAFPYGSHIRYDVVFGAEPGTGIRNVEVKDRNSGEWSDIDLEAVYSVATNSFTATGKDGYQTFADVIAANPEALVESDVAYTIPLIEYLRDELEGGVLPKLDAQNYSVKSSRGRAG
ncbi:5'-nucleotidase C-terminal domain-containing protein [Pseudovibrio exalbescens]|uniref:bifunctional metallophosphatase/5'-nucleotidase n=1 Tax=Pseudovibrio exalbescens TaxID=197461 RepID=UPI002365B803|nr:5'-nucleotidase C-terminal domain-containing protein [Pseudovibrio exalbescens]MDD7910027.1 5'-nucleotidase C-terminal domain-containing protein [Pseudovibrio exalbescens]